MALDHRRSSFGKKGSLTVDHGIAGWNESVPQTDIPVEEVNQYDL